MDKVNHSYETWKALAQADPVGTFDKLVNELIDELELTFSGAQKILANCENDHRTACEYILEKYKPIFSPTSQKVIVPPPLKDDKKKPTFWADFWAFWGWIIVSIIAGSAASRAFGYDIAGLLLGIPLSWLASFLVLIYAIKDTGKNERRGLRTALIIYTAIQVIALIIAVVILFSTYVDATGPAPTPTRTLRPPTPKATIVPIVTPAAAAANCYQWSEIKPSMQGQQVCVYGIIDSIYTTNDSWTRIKFSDQPNTFFIDDTAYIYQLSAGECITVTQTIQLYENIPFMEISSELLYCEPWMENQ